MEKGTFEIGTNNGDNIDDVEKADIVQSLNDGQSSQRRKRLIAFGVLLLLAVTAVIVPLVRDDQTSPAARR
jgi:hypothetical protein